MYGTHTNSHFGTRLCTRLPLGLEETVGYVWARNSWPLRPFGPFFSLGATAESWAQDGCLRDRFPWYPYIRGSSWCSRDITDITWSQKAESFAAALNLWF